MDVSFVISPPFISYIYELAFLFIGLSLPKEVVTPAIGVGWEMAVDGVFHYISAFFLAFLFLGCS